MDSQTLERKQAAMRRRVRRRRERERKHKRAGISDTQEQREFEILNALQCFTNRTASYDSLRLASASRPFGRGWWRKTFLDLEEAGLLAFVEIRGRDFVRLTKTGLASVFNHMSKAEPHNEMD